MNNILSRVFATNEFEKNNRLSYIGYAFSLILLLSALFWLDRVPRILSSQDAYCWPFFETCQGLRPFSRLFSYLTLGAMTVLALASMLALYWRRWAWHICFIFGAYALKFLVFIQDYRLMGNYHWMPFWAIFIYVFARQKVFFLRLLVCLFYFFAGLLKLSQEWISGEALLSKSLGFFLPTEIFTIFVILLELILIWGLFWHKTKKYILLLLLFFHVFSWHQVGYFYPSVMALLLCCFYLVEDEFSVSRKPKYSWFVGSAFIVFFLLAQMPQYFSKTDPAITGGGRFFSLNMIDVHSQCQAYTFLEQDNAYTDIGLYESLGIRIHCDPIVHMQRWKNLCQNYKDNNYLGKLHVFLASKRTTATEWTVLMQAHDFCASDYVMNSFSDHDWVLKNHTQKWHKDLGPTFKIADGSKISGEQTIVRSLKNVQNENLNDRNLKKLKNKIKLLPVNTGIHTAAKSTPIADESGFYVASDAGVLRKIDWLGKIIWTFNFHRSGLGIHASPVIRGDSIFIGTYSGDFYRISKNTGKLIWVKKIADTIGATPVLYKNNFFINAEFSTSQKWGGVVVSLNADNGEVNWRSVDLPDQSHSTPAIDINRNLLVFGSNDGYLRWVDMDSGVIKQSVFLAEAPSKGPVVIYDDAIYVANWIGGLLKVDFSEGVIWSNQRESMSMSAPVVLPSSQSVFYGDLKGRLWRLHKDSGQVQQTWSLGQRGLKSNILAVGSDLFLGCDDSSLCRLNVSVGSIEKIVLDGRVTSTPFLWGHKMLVSTDAPGSLWVLEFQER